MSDLAKTPLFAEHQALDARIVDFGGWALPVNYGSQVDEHHSVRQRSGMFDVSHMTVSDMQGKETLAALRTLLANDIDKAAALPGKAVYSCMLNEAGGVIDDLIVYRLSDTHCRLITNAATNAKDMAWIKKHVNDYDASFTERPELALIAVQGPEAIAKVTSLDSVFADKDMAQITQLSRFQGTFLSARDNWFVGRTGYTGEDGLELVLPAQDAGLLWQALLNAKVQPCGLGARDTLRLEAGMALYGNDLDEQHTPLESGIAWSVALKDDRPFIGRNALTTPPAKKMIGLVLLDRGVLRGHQMVFKADEDQAIGEITSGTFSPTLEKSIALARVHASAELKTGDLVEIEVRNKRLRAQVTPYPFVKNGQAT